MRRTLVLGVPVAMLLWGGCSSSDAPAASSAPPTTAAPTTAPPTTAAPTTAPPTDPPTTLTTLATTTTTAPEPVIDVSGAVAALRAVAAEAAARGMELNGNDIGGTGPCPLGLEGDIWAAETGGAVYCQVGDGAQLRAWFVAITDHFELAEFLAAVAGTTLDTADLGPYEGGVLSSHCFTSDGDAGCIVVWESGDLVVGISALTADPVPLVPELTADLETVVVSVASLDVGALQF